ncbi:DUF6795 domain-containing protein [Aliikangiella maris]|uniref:Carboxypeptidase-like regulatory domain-containing protein n=2 Tax=Aliikangiella maris TaxID=3162458 RepID=A0ABV2BVM6_9GAMM
MAFLDYFQFYLFSAVKGRVHDNGTPLVGAKLTRTAQDAFNSKTYTDYAYTNDDGYFEFAPIKIWIFRPFIEPRSFQEIKVRYQGKEKLAWEMTKRDFTHGCEIAFSHKAKTTPIEVDCNWSSSENKIQKILLSIDATTLLLGFATILNVKNKD